MENLKKWLEPTKNKVIAGAVSICVVVLVVSAVAFFKKPIALIKFQEETHFEKYTYLDHDSIDSKIDSENSKYTSYEVEYIRDGEVVTFDEMKNEQINAYIQENKIKDLETFKKDKAELFKLLDTKDKMPLVSDLDIRLNVKLDNGKDAQIDYSVKVVDSIKPIIKVSTDNKELKDKDKVIVSSDDDLKKVLSVTATDNRFNKDIEIDYKNETINNKEYDTFKVVAMDSTNKAEFSVFIYTKDLENLTQEEVEELKEMGVVNSETLNTKNELANTGDNNSSAGNSSSNSENDAPSNNGGSSSGGNTTPPSNNGGNSSGGNTTPPSNNGNGGSTALCPNGYDPNLPCDAPIHQHTEYSKMLVGYSFADADAWAENIFYEGTYNGVDIGSYAIFEVKTNDNSSYGYVIYFKDSNENTIL